MAAHRKLLCLLVGSAIALASMACQREPPRNHTLYVVMPAGPVDDDPLKVFDEVSDAVLGNVFQRVMPEPGNDDPTSSVVASWINPDLRTWELKVRAGLRFHDGRPVTPRDVAASIQTVMAEPASPFNQFTKDIIDVKVLDSDRVKVTTSGPINLAPGLAFVPVVPGGRHPADGDLPVGSGPYRVVSWQEGRRIVLERVERVAPGRRSPARVEFVIASGAEKIRGLGVALRPLLVLMMPPESRDEAPELGLRLVSTPTRAAVYVICNVRPGRLTADLEVRRAVAAATDPKAMIAELGADEVPADDILPAGVFGYVRGRYRVSPAWRRAARVPEEPLDLLVMETVSKVGGSLQGLLQKAGFRVRLTTSPVPEALSALADGRFDLSVLGYGCASGSGLELFELAFSERHGTGQSWNFSGYRNPTVDTLVNEAERAIDPASQHDQLVRIGQMILDDLPWIPVLEVRRVAAASPRVEWVPAANGRFNLRDVEIRQ